MSSSSSSLRSMIVALPLFEAEPKVEDPKGLSSRSRPADCDRDNQELGSIGCKACEDEEDVARAGPLVGEELPVVKVLKLL
jgi:hypothetical protein